MNTTLINVGQTLGEGCTFLQENLQIAEDIESLFGTSAEGFARSVLGYIFAHGKATEPQTKAIRKTAARLAHPSAPVPSYTVERGLTGLKPLAAAEPVEVPVEVEPEVEVPEVAPEPEVDPLTQLGWT